MRAWLIAKDVPRRHLMRISELRCGAVRFFRDGCALAPTFGESRQAAELAARPQWAPTRRTVALTVDVHCLYTSFAFERS